ncbi:radical SAM family heme chaperone HemW [Paracholeplasma manati]|uniref:radical SAM family heme chaperone HemW n=1 Tax=Paracholeplasma manati TaxID=591373 RepID=UPI002407F618|nr:radical SAM family heme chaperone HemW [Paracholeplasma manati]MDG0888178.1 radical SAM family heme chaperone HemW [Paracholeplasma manati]
MKGLYVHIPFCEHICFYCDFAKRVAKNREMIDEYLVHLKKEFDQIPLIDRQFDTVYIGGGTPSMLDIKQLTYLLELFKDLKPLEYTIEVNPESYTHDKGMLFKQYGINRVSLGVQSFEPEILTYIGRKHDNTQVFYAIEDLNDIGIDNISIDLIFAIPGQTMASIKHDLDIVSTLAIKHISYYSLILEEKTVFYHQYLKKQFRKADIDLEADMYEYIIDRLNALGFNQYEISNFTKGPHASKHNQLYWSMDPYIGIGAGAHGFDGKLRTQNHRNLPDYYENPLASAYHETDQQYLSDTLIFGLRRLGGILIDDIEARFGFKLFEKYPKLIQLQALGLIEIVDQHLRLTRKGLLLGNQVFEVFI